MNRKEIEESKCREFVSELNRLAEHERYRYIGHVSELQGKEFPDCLIKDRRTSSELHVECTRYTPAWLTVEEANMRVLEQRFAYDLRDIGYENYDIFLQTRNPFSHPLQKLNRSGVEDLARSVKRFLIDQKPQVINESFRTFNMDEFFRYRPLATTFQFVLVDKLSNPQAVSCVDDGSPIVRVGVIGFELSEIDKRLEEAIVKKLRGPGYTADILLVYSEGPLFLFDVDKTGTRLKEIIAAQDVQKWFREIWFLAHYWTGDQKLYQVA